MNWSDLRTRVVSDPPTHVLPPQIKLPMLPAVVLEFSRKADDPNSSPRELGKLIETDSTLTCELLKYANSSAIATRGKLSTPQQAISRLGTRNAKSFLLSTAINQTMKASKSKLFNVQNLWLTNLERAFFAAEIARKLGADSDIAYAGSLLQDFLLPVLGNELYEEYVSFLSTKERQECTLCEYENSRFGWNHAQATAQVLFGWGFPDDLVCCVAMQHGGLAVLNDRELGSSPIAAIAVAALMPDPLRQTPDGLDQLLLLEGIWPQFKLFETAETIATKLLESTPLASQHTSLQRRLEKHLQPTH